MSAQPLEESRAVSEGTAEKKENNEQIASETDKKERKEQTPADSTSETDKKERTPADNNSETDNWGDFAANAKSLEPLVSFADELTEIPDIRTEETGGDNEGWERHHGRRDSDDNGRSDRYRPVDRDRKYDRRFERGGEFSPRKRRSYDEGGRRGIAYESGYDSRDGYRDKRDGGRFGSRYEDRDRRDDDRFDDRRGGDRGFRGGRQDFGARGGYVDDERRGSFGRRDYGERGGPRGGDDRRMGDRDPRRDNDRFRSYDRDRGDSRSGGRGSNLQSPPPSKVVGIFGIPVSVVYEELTDFLKYHIPSIPYQNVHLVKDRQTNMSRGFAFVYFDSIEDSTRAKDALVNKEIQNKRVRVDFAIGEGPRPQKY
ncbi:hypothetical protein VCUG_00651 [Vavraia culicis subsp. floridensis]|uniref:RRM domain-containing protein n=1 Tax=Vavraia culicis (isolate floridensis) TaxID=948595 RepID=L2GW01_VAVCU|nr:uncharacterized protein VCUG_00651 [Vavraia culicis subsp. floridensis]ELA47809.1 hypothetical protein VCUG_00651 [Vavraia culicis subsp. floridensis]